MPVELPQPVTSAPADAEPDAERERTRLDTALRLVAVLGAPGLRKLRKAIDARLGSLTGTGAALSDRELWVLRLIALGHRNKGIAARLKVSTKSVETYKARGMEKLGLRDRVELVRHAIANGWLDTD